MTIKSSPTLKNFIGFCGAAITVLLAGCQSNVSSTNDAHHDQVELVIKQQESWNDIPYVKHSSKWYRPEIRESRKDMPDWCFKPIQSGVYTKARVDMVMRMVTKGLPVSTSFVDVNGEQPITVNTGDDVCDTIAKIASATGYSYTIDNNKITFNQYEERTVPVLFAAGTQTWFMGSDKATSNSSSNSSSNNDVTTTQSDAISKSPEFKAVSAEVNPWANLVSVLNQMKSEHGFIGPNQAAGNIMIRDVPERVTSMVHYVEELNRKVNTTLGLHVQVYQLTSTQGRLEGFDATQLISKITSKVTGTYTGSYSSGLYDDTTSVPSLDLAYVNSSGDSSSLLIKTLSEYGKISVVRDQRFTLLNNQVARVKKVINDVYLAKAETSTTSNVGTSDELIAGSVQSGIDMYAQAREYKNQVQVHLTSNITNLLSIGEVESGDSKIQTPSVDEQSFDTIALIPTNKAILLTSVSSDKASSEYSGAADDRGILGYLGRILGYSKGDTSERTETIIVISGQVMYKDS